MYVIKTHFGFSSNKFTAANPGRKRISFKPILTLFISNYLMSNIPFGICIHYFVEKRPFVLCTNIHNTQLLLQF